MKLKGFNDILPDSTISSSEIERIEEAAKTILSLYDFERVYLPALESTTLFNQNLGQETDVVLRQMYSFRDNGNRDVTLRPEGTAGAVRAYIFNGYAKSNPVQRWWYSGNMFRAENSQLGRYRQFHQLGIESYGRDDAISDAETIVIAQRICERIGIKDYIIKINMLPSKKGLERYSETIREVVSKYHHDLCSDCRGRLQNAPLNLLDCKESDCQTILEAIPGMNNFLCEDSKARRNLVFEMLKDTRIIFEYDRGSFVAFIITRTSSLNSSLDWMETMSAFWEAEGMMISFEMSEVCQLPRSGSRSGWKEWLYAKHHTKDQLPIVSSVGVVRLI